MVIIPPESIAPITFSLGRHNPSQPRRRRPSLLGRGIVPGDHMVIVPAPTDVAVNVTYAPVHADVRVGAGCADAEAGRLTENPRTDVGSDK
jgi:hypothetical protein